MFYLLPTKYRMMLGAKKNPEKHRVPLHPVCAALRLLPP